jgi:hypothetical protein
VLVTVGVIFVMFLFKMAPARSVIILFGSISFILVFLSEELLRLGYKSGYGQLQFTKRVILVGSKMDTKRMRSELEARAVHGLEILAELDLNETTIRQLVQVLHEHSPNGVILNAKHTYFGQIEKAIQACELEGVEA